MAETYAPPGPLFTDLYQLTMAQAYYFEGMRDRAAFELFYRQMPSCRNYTVGAGIDRVLAFLERFQFDSNDLAYLESQKLFRAEFLDALARVRFEGDVFAVAEGTAVFPNEPILRVEAPILEAQLVETYILNQIHFETVVASKCARVVTAAKGKTVVDFGSRRAHGTDAALLSARACYLVGGQGTSNVLAGKLFGIPIFGTMAHSYVQSHESEDAAFESFHRLYPGTTLLVDTYDTLEGIRRVIRLRDRLGNAFKVRAVRLDSGDLAALAKEARQMLDAAGLQHVRIFASSELDEYRIGQLLEAGAPIDGFGVGTHMVVSIDAPTLDMAYKLVEYAGQPRMKLSSHKELFPGKKQVFRQIESGRFARDILACHDEAQPGEPLLRPVMKSGKRLDAGRVALEQARRHCIEQIASLPAHLLSLQRADPPYPVEISPKLRRETDALRARLQAQAS